MNEIEKKLKAPFPGQDIKWRGGATSKDKTSALALAYIDARSVMDRLDEAVGSERWQDEYQIVETEKGTAVICRLGVDHAGRGDNLIWKSDAAGLSNYDPIKGGISDAFKRAAVKHGIGRYLYNLPGIWVECETSGKLKTTPPLPDWALPSGTPLGEKKPKKKTKEEAEEFSKPKKAVERPMPPKVLKEMIAGRAQTLKNEGANAPKDKRNILAARLTKILGSDENRYLLCGWLVGYKSSKKMSANYVVAVLRWLKVEGFDDAPDKFAVQEAKAAFEFVMEGDD